MTTILDRPTHCRVCERSLEGMRMGGGCPTCGAPLDSEREAIHQASLSTTALLTAGIVLFLLSAAGKPVGNWEASVLLVLSLCIVVTWCVIRTHRRRAVLWEGGFVLIGRKDEPEIFRWEDIATMQWNTDGDGLTCVDGEGKPVTTIEANFFGTHRQAERFAEAAILWASHSPQGGEQ